jgi:hypothetical protein
MKNCIYQKNLLTLNTAETACYKEKHLYLRSGIAIMTISAKVTDSKRRDGL